MSDFNLLRLVVPFRYELNTNRGIYSRPNLMTWYDIEHPRECKDMLELILRANHYNCDISKFISWRHKSPDNIDCNKYAYILTKLLEIIEFKEIEPASFVEQGKWLCPCERYADFGNIEYNLFGDRNPLYIVKNKRTGAYIIVVKQNGALLSVGEISLWQARYITICRAILQTKDNRSIGTIKEKSEQLVKSYKQLCEQTVAIIESKISEPLSIETEPDAKIESDLMNAYIESYKKLIAGREEFLETEMVDRSSSLAIIKKAKDGYITVELNADCTLVLHTDFIPSMMKKLEKVYPCKENLSDYAIDDVKIVPVNDDDNYFAYPGFKYNNVLYKISDGRYKTMYSGVTSISLAGKIPKDLLASVSKLHDDIANLLEFEFCEDAVAKCDGNIIKISHGSNQIRIDTDINPDISLVKFRQIVGKYKDKPYLFLNIGKQRYKIRELNECELICMFMEDYIKSAACIKI